jgi:flagellar hook assembly protein FlgD
MAGLTNVTTPTSGPSYLNPGKSQSETQAERLDLTRDQFFKILIAQLQSQDPMAPMDQGQFLGQLAQLESLNTQQKMTSGIEDLTSTLKFNHLNDASSMLGKVITGTTKEQKLDADNHPVLDDNGQPVYENKPAQGLASRVVTDGKDTNLILLVPVIGSDGEVIRDPQGGILTREIPVEMGTITEILDPLVGADAVPTGG